MSEQAEQPTPDQPTPDQPTPDAPTPDTEQDDETTADAPEVTPDAPAEPPYPGAEQGDDGQPEQPATTQPPGAVGEREIEKMMKRVDTANARYSKQLGEIMGEEATVLESCPRCAQPFLGFIFPAAMKPVDAETKNRVLESVGEQPALAVNPDPFSRRCDTCDGAGAVLTGSRLNNEKAIRCYTCNGRGWVPVGDERRVGRSDVQPVPTTNGHVEPPTLDASPPTQAPDTDIWGRRVGDPNYGVHPMYETSR